MKLPIRDYLVISLSLLIIFSCGSGVGYLLGHDKGRKESAAKAKVAKTQGNDSQSWENLTLVRLSKHLELTPEQKQKIGQEISRVSTEMRESRKARLKSHYRHILLLHERILPHLDERQRQQVLKDRKILEREVNRKLGDSGEGKAK